MLKYGLRLMFGAFSQTILAVIAYEFYLRYALTTGGHGYTSAFSAIPPIIKSIIAIELIIAIVLIVLGAAEVERSRKGNVQGINRNSL